MRPYLGRLICGSRVVWSHAGSNPAGRTRQNIPLPIGVVMAETKLLRCTCKSKYQDKKYGRKRRVHNVRGVNPKHGTRGYRCTVCGSEKK